MTLKLGTTMRNLIADAMGTELASATLSVYTGSQPADPQATATGTKLVDITLTSFDTAASGVAALNTASPNEGTAVATGTAGWARLISASSRRIDGTVGTSGTDFIINTASITNGGTVTLIEMDITQPES